MRLIDADKLLIHLNDYTLSASPDSGSLKDQMIARVEYDTIQGCITAVEEQPDVGVERWISVDERTPETSDTYIVCCKEQDLKHVTFAKFYKKLGYWELKGSRTFWKVTHWMRLPEPPDTSTNTSTDTPTKQLNKELNYRDIT